MSEVESLKNISKGKHGGARPGAGHPKGKQTAKVLERLEAAKVFKDRVAKNVDRLFNAQIDLAVGEKYLMVVRTVGKGAKARRETVIITDVEKIKEYFDSGESIDSENEYYFMTTKPANNQAIEGMLNRSFGKAQEKIDITSDGQAIQTSNLTDEELDAKIRRYIKETGTS